MEDREERVTTLKRAASLIIGTVDNDPKRPGLKDTPRRFAEAFLDDFAPDGSPEDALGQMVMEEKFDQMILVRDVFVRSFCEHHILPWFGRATIGYIPNDLAVGLSKITRMVRAAGRGLTIQERVTERIADAMNSVLRPLGVMVVMEAIHTCTLMRGVKVEFQQFTTSATRGVFLTNPAPRAEFLSLMSRNGRIL